MKRSFVIFFAALLSLSAFGQEAKKQPKYTGADFFNALDLPLVVGVTYTPKSLETVGFTTTMCLEWRWRKSYSWFVPITIDTHNSQYDNLQLPNSNIVSGSIWYTEVNLGVGYRLPLVKDIADFYQKPYANKVDLFLSVLPGVTLNNVKNVELAEWGGYLTPDQPLTLNPNLKFNVGVEWFVDPKLCLFLQASYIQHLTPTVLEQAAINQHTASGPTGPLMFCVGLSTFFE